VAAAAFRRELDVTTVIETEARLSSVNPSRRACRADTSPPLPRLRGSGGSCEYVEPTCATELLAHSGAGGIGYLLKGRVLDVADFVDAVRRRRPPRSCLPTR
jgi:hypothetical protein